jgi:hypothetical protein
MEGELLDDGSMNPKHFRHLLTRIYQRINAYLSEDFAWDFVSLARSHPHETSKSGGSLAPM